MNIQSTKNIHRDISRLVALLVVCLLPVSLAAQDAVKTLAGSVLNSGSVDGGASVALFGDPAGLAMDTNGNLYVADNANHTIRKLSPDGIVSTLAGQAGQPGCADGTGTNALFYNPTGIAVGFNGTLYVTDTGNQTIRQITADGVVSTLAGQVGINGATNGPGGVACFDTPLGIALGPGGVLCVADSVNHLIRTVSTNGIVSTLAGTAGVWGSADGPAAAAQFNSPAGIAVDGGGNVFVSDSNNHTIRKITPASMVSTWAGLPGIDGHTDGAGTNALFCKPGEIKFDRNGNLFVVESFNDTVRMITTNAVVTTLAGSPGSGGATDGVGTQARFLNPYGLAVDRNGNLRVSDTYNETIRLVYAPIAAAASLEGGGNVVISWQAATGDHYQVQYRGAFDGAAWQNLGAVITATGTTATETDNSGPGAPRRFYRVQLLP